MVPKVFLSKRISYEAAADANEVEGLDIELISLKPRKDKNILMHDVQNRVEALESHIQEIEEVMGCVYWCLIKTRVSLINILGH